MKNIHDLIKKSAQVFEDLESDALNYQTAREMNKAVGNVIRANTAQLQYAQLRGEKPNIEFLKGKK